MVEHLLPHKPDLVAVDGEGRNAVQLAVMAEDVSPLLIKRLVELGIAADATDPVGRRADYAAEAGRWAIVALLDPSYPRQPSVMAWPSAVKRPAPAACCRTVRR